jgi:ubiquinone/menaquinone biosynthesis C-methylase UbiE
MNTEAAPTVADEKKSVAALYEDASVAESYLQKRMKFSWQRLLHERQIREMNRVILKCKPNKVLEIAPGPARLAVELKGIDRGVMVENSEEMIAIARSRLAAAGLQKTWEVISGNAFALHEVLPEAGFDLAFTFRFLRHFRTAEREQLYASIRSRLKPGGLLVFDVVNATMLKRIEQANPTRPADELAVYDVSYTQDQFEQEMQYNGFTVEEMTPVIRHFPLQSTLSYKLDDVMPSISQTAVNFAEAIPSKTSLEWIAVCRKR